MDRRFLLKTGCLAAAFPPQAGAATKASGTLRNGDHCYLVDFNANGQLGSGMLDTGAGRSVFSIEFAKRAGFEPSGHAIRMSGSSVHSKIFRIAKPIKIVICGIDIEIYEPLVLEQNFDAVIGQEFFGHHIVRLDPLDNTLTVEPGRLTRGPHTIPFISSPNDYTEKMLPISVEGHEPIHAILDTGMQHALKVTTDYFINHNMTADHDLNPIDIGSPIDGRRSGLTTTMHKVTIAGIDFINVPCHVFSDNLLGADAQLGWGLISRCEITMDSQSQLARLRLRMNADLSHL